MRAMNQFLCRSVKLMALPAFWLVFMAFTPKAALTAQEHTFNRTIHKQFPTSRESTLDVQNKYGKIQVSTWDKDSVSLEVEVFLTESSASKLRKLKQDISIDFTGTNNYIIAKSKFKSESGRIASELKSVTHTITGTNKHVEINYLVLVPDYLDVVLTNKFGDIYLDDLSGQVDIALSNGVLKAGGLEGNSNISLSFANGMIKSLGSCNMSLSYSDLALSEVSQLDLTSKSSKLNADSVNVLKIDSRRDKLYFQRVEYLYGNSNFTQVWIYDFLRESDVHMKYGELTIEHVIPKFSKIYVESDYTDVTPFFDVESAFAFDILHHEKSVLRLPGGLSNLQENLEGDDYYRTTGTLGSENAAGDVTIDALQKCFINLSIK